MKTPTHEQLEKYWKITIKILTPILKRIYNYSCDKAPEIEGNYMVVSNHYGSLDPWMLGQSFNKQMYFLAGENVFRMGFLSWIVKKYWAPLSIQKGKSDVTSMIRLIRHLKKGYNVSLFPEGNRSYTGENEYIAPSIGKLAKVGGSALVTYRFEGMYFTVPRWGKVLRRGKCSGKIVNIYTKEQLKKMSPEEVYNHIIEDTKNNDYEIQEKNPVAYKGKRRAECIESVLFMCPKCKTVGSIESKKHMFHCTTCNAKAEYTVYGKIDGDFGYTTIRDWDIWQTAELKKRIVKAIEEKSDKAILFDEGLELTKIDEDHNEEIVARGRFCFYYDKITVGDKEIPIENIIELETVFRRTIVFSTNNNGNYQIFSKDLKSARNYIIAHEIIRNLNNNKET